MVTSVTEHEKAKSKIGVDFTCFLFHTLDLNGTTQKILLVNIFENRYNNPVRISEIFSDRSVRKSQNKQLNRGKKDVVCFGEIQYNTHKGSSRFRRGTGGDY